jgi:hypothetical protein
MQRTQHGKPSVLDRVVRRDVVRPNSATKRLQYLAPEQLARFQSAHPITRPQVRNSKYHLQKRTVAGTRHRKVIAGAEKQGTVAFV